VRGAPPASETSQALLAPPAPQRHHRRPRPPEADSFSPLLALTGSGAMAVLERALTVVSGGQRQASHALPDRPVYTIAPSSTFPSSSGRGHAIVLAWSGMLRLLAAAIGARLPVSGRLATPCLDSLPRYPGATTPAQIFLEASDCYPAAPIVSLVALPSLKPTSPRCVKLIRLVKASSAVTPSLAPTSSVAARASPPILPLLYVHARCLH
jgi:hypothetical protein